MKKSNQLSQIIIQTLNRGTAFKSEIRKITFP